MQKVFTGTILPLVLLLSGCAGLTVQPAVFVPRAVIETLSSEVSVAARSPKGSMSGNGYLLYRRPDAFRLSLFTPFGTTAMEATALGETLTLAFPPQGVAYAGNFAELPEGTGGQAWRGLRWAFEKEPAGDARPQGEVTRRDSDGRSETLTYSSEGLLEKRSLEGGEEVVYSKYLMVKGVPVPTVVEYTDGKGTSVKVRLREPEVNVSLEEGALEPKIHDFTVFPLSLYRG